ncbi:hypothetical protein GGS23DRAFT_409978 [Durotheca rogersii]|uniref:uncharacterized protein n=1 Tax=Durotheca rogersii TaxID=419775 RepID=UPI00221E920B|nr:uncharacterized protein GGS23DRAFT_409978 [Durotheca rogersii]KAI5865112.1 hypothetical protein GGS23DRAFT_409978 [Durotheca rogersii]
MRAHAHRPRVLLPSFYKTARGRLIVGFAPSSLHTTCINPVVQDLPNHSRYSMVILIFRVIEHKRIREGRTGPYAVVYLFPARCCIRNPGIGQLHPFVDLQQLHFAPGASLFFILLLSFSLFLSLSRLLVSPLLPTSLGLSSPPPLPWEACHGSLYQIPLRSRRSSVILDRGEKWAVIPDLAMESDRCVCDCRRTATIPGMWGAAPTRAVMSSQITHKLTWHQTQRPTDREFLLKKQINLSVFHNMPGDLSRAWDGTGERHRASRPMIRRAGLETLTGFVEGRYKVEARYHWSSRHDPCISSTVSAKKCATAEGLGHNRGSAWSYTRGGLDARSHSDSRQDA